MSGRDIGGTEPNLSCAGNEELCEPAKTPLDAHPMLMLVPMATYFSPPCVCVFNEPPGDAAGAVVCVASEHAARVAAAHKATSWVFVFIVAPGVVMPDWELVIAREGFVCRCTAHESSSRGEANEGCRRRVRGFGRTRAAVWLGDLRCLVSSGRSE